MHARWVQALSIPVLANGNIRHIQDAHACLEYTGCDGVLSAESLLEDPALFSPRRLTSEVGGLPCPGWGAGGAYVWWGVLALEGCSLQAVGIGTHPGQSAVLVVCRPRQGCWGGHEGWGGLARPKRCAHVTRRHLASPGRGP